MDKLARSLYIQRTSLVFKCTICCLVKDRFNNEANCNSTNMLRQGVVSHINYKQKVVLAHCFQFITNCLKIIVETLIVAPLKEKWWIQHLSGLLT